MDDYDSSDGEDSKNGDALEDPMAERTLVGALRIPPPVVQTLTWPISPSSSARDP